MLFLLILKLVYAGKLSDLIVAARVDRGFSAEPAAVMNVLAENHGKALQLPQVLTDAFKSRLRVMTLLHRWHQRVHRLVQDFAKSFSANKYLVWLHDLEEEFNTLEKWFRVVWKSHKPLTSKVACTSLREGLEELRKQHQLTLSSFRRGKFFNQNVLERLLQSYHHVHLLFLRSAGRMETEYLKNVPVREYSLDFHVFELREALTIDERLYATIKICKFKNNEEARNLVEMQWSFFAESLKRHKPAFEDFAKKLSV